MRNEIEMEPFGSIDAQPCPDEIAPRAQLRYLIHICIYTYMYIYIYVYIRASCWQRCVEDLVLNTCGLRGRGVSPSDVRYVTFCK